MRERGVSTDVDCPACGVTAEMGRVSYWADTGELHCRSCLFTIAAGVVGYRGHDVPPERVRALTVRDERATEEASSYRPTSQRRWVLRLVPREDAGAAREPRLATLAALAADPSVSSITIRVNRRGGAR